MKWSYSKIPLMIEDVRELENTLQVTYPSEYKKIILVNHGARPDKKRFLTSTQTERVIKSFIPVTRDYDINLFSLIDWLDLPIGVIPFASTPSGDYICFHFKDAADPVIILYHHEINSFENVNKNFDQFIQSLY
ncbi:SMI1/KNR4 family protein [Cytobacillus massiliigabonensis]|uniref:SMI1/KNR4 family protein n=1 Tax=Cytobacillus massiliigabonensis TaxID=1871011 RepID=UPI000C8390F2|nr:SMI1/KNR4 family protein [Cytobacillus massiliigabonensis]